MNNIRLDYPLTHARARAHTAFIVVHVLRYDVRRQSWGVGTGAAGCKGRGYRRYTTAKATNSSSNDDDGDSSSNDGGGGSRMERKSRTYRSETWVAGQYYGHVVVTSHKSVLDFEFTTPGGERKRNNRRETRYRHDHHGDHSKQEEEEEKKSKRKKVKQKQKQAALKPPKRPNSSYIMFVVDTRPGSVPTLSSPAHFFTC